MMGQIKEVIVVEGNHDKSKILQVYPDADVLITNGSEISKETLQTFKTLNESRGLILMLDPDVPGEKIRKIINAYAGDTKHVFLPKRECIDSVKAKVGIEHAPNTVIENALKNHVYDSTLPLKPIGKHDLLSRGLIGSENASVKREKVTNAYHLGLCNGKTFLKKLNMFNISLNMIDAVIK